MPAYVFIPLGVGHVMGKTTLDVSVDVLDASSADACLACGLDTE
tara:strand:+ start:17707 stop:17838 length:132 start_codon:yes stop_codon:yes gene_type:complete